MSARNVSAMPNGGDIHLKEQGWISTVLVPVAGELAFLE